MKAAVKATVFIFSTELIKKMLVRSRTEVPEDITVKASV